LIDQYLEDYSRCNSKAEKSDIVTRLVDAVMSRRPDGGFIKFDNKTGRWHKVSKFLCLKLDDIWHVLHADSQWCFLSLGDHIAREKVGQK
jgi:hypothetical protein